MLLDSTGSTSDALSPCATSIFIICAVVDAQAEIVIFSLWHDLLKPGFLHSGGKIALPPDELAAVLGPGFILQVERPRTLPGVGVPDAPFIDEVGQPVLPLPVVLGGLLAQRIFMPPLPPPAL